MDFCVNLRIEKGKRIWYNKMSNYIRKEMTKMKRFFALILAMLMLLGGCGAAVDTQPVDGEVTEAPTVTEAHETEAPATEPDETEAYVPVIKDGFTIDVKEDTYVYRASDNTEVNNNFGAAEDLHLKSSSNWPIRYTYLKFDISALANDKDFTAVDLKLMLKLKQNDPGNPDYAVVEIYGAPVDAWSENTLTYNTQPEHYDLICSRDDIAGNGTVFDFPVTAYIKYALSKGETQVAFFIKENTSTALHIKFESKESGKHVPQLEVFYGTKTDDSVYSNTILDDGKDPELSKNGLDAILGLHKTESYRINVSEDTYVQAGKTADENFGASEMLDFKLMRTKPDEYYRIPLLKFDISSDILTKEYDKLYLELVCTMIESIDHPTTLHVYGCYPGDWDEMTVTYNTIPEKEELINTVIVTGTGTVRIDVTDYVEKLAKLGYKQISFMLEGDSDSIRRLNFNSKEKGADIPALVFGIGNDSFTTYVKYSGENPWELAMEYVSTWLRRWEVIKQGGDNDIQVIKKDDSEYSVTVGKTNASGTKGASTKYTDTPTRIVSTLKGYTASTAETAKYDVYGGLIDESMKQEATGFFYTKKIGDRWWTIDPLGYPFFRTAIVTITSGGSTKQKDASKAIYGDNSTNWAQATTTRLRELGFNSAGGWSATASLIKADQPITQTGIMYVAKKYCQANGIDVSESGNTTLLRDVIPVFDPEFEISAEATVKSAVSAYATNPNIYGWMSDNELPQSRNMLDSALTLDTTDTRFIYTYAVAWTFMYLKTGKLDVSVFDVTDELRREYRAMVYDRYFEVVTKQLEKYAPYHQYMGCRFLQQCYSDEYVMRVAGYWCDVVTLNYYGAWEADFELVANQVKWAGKPIVITEWYAKGMDVWEKDNRMTNESGAGFTVKTQEDRGKFYQNYALSMLECGGCVGIDWFMFWDNDPDNLSADLSNRNANKGILSNDGQEYTDLTKYMAELNNQKYNLIKFFDAR